MWPFLKRQTQRNREEEKYNKKLYCSFCGKSRDEVKKLIAGPAVYICDECVNLCNDIISEEWELEEDEKKELVDGTHSPRPQRSLRTHTAGPSCALCGMNSPVTEVLFIPDRGPLCFICLDVIRATSGDARDES